MARKAIIPGLQARITELEVALNNATTEHLEWPQLAVDLSVESVRAGHSEELERLTREHDAVVKQKDAAYAHAMAQLARQAAAIDHVHAILDAAGVPLRAEGDTNAAQTMITRLAAVFMGAFLRGVAK